MNKGSTVFAQLMNYLPMHEFRKCVERYQGNYKVRKFSCLDQFLCMAFAQLTYRESLRDIETCLRVMQTKLYHMGFRGKVSRSTLADANESRDWRIYRDFAYVLIRIANDLYDTEEFSVELNQTVYALDSTTIELCLSLFPWAKFRWFEAAIKIHTLLNLRGNIPSFVHITKAKVHDVNILDKLVPEPGAFYIMDRAYLDFRRLYIINQARAFFITLARRNFKFGRLYSQPLDKSTGLKCDQIIALKTFRPSRKYPEYLRRIRYFDAETQNDLTFLTNNFTLSAITIAQLYKCRWQIEIFFKWIKQHLRIKAFYGTSFNAVKTQVWIAISVYVLVAIFKKQECLDLSLHTILQILSVTIFEKTPILQAINTYDYKQPDFDGPKQLLLFDL